MFFFGWGCMSYNELCIYAYIYILHISQHIPTSWRWHHGDAPSSTPSQRAGVAATTRQNFSRCSSCGQSVNWSSQNVILNHQQYILYECVILFYHVLSLSLSLSGHLTIKNIRILSTLTGRDAHPSGDFYDGPNGKFQHTAELRTTVQHLWLMISWLPSSKPTQIWNITILYG